MDVPVGATVEGLDQFRHVPRLRIPSGDHPEREDENRQDYGFQSSGASDSSRTFNFERGSPMKTLNVPPIPRVRKEVATFMLQLSDNILAISSRQDNKEVNFARSCQAFSLKNTRHCRKMDLVKKRFIRLDRVMRPALLKAVENAKMPRLNDWIKREREIGRASCRERV